PIYSDISIMYVEYDMAGASDSTIYFYDESEILIHSIYMDLLDSSYQLYYIDDKPDVFERSYNYSLIDDFEHTLWNWDFSFGLLDWFEFPEDEEDLFFVGSGGALDGVLGVITTDSNTLL